MSQNIERAELHRALWKIANDLRGSVDGWDFKQYVLGIMFYRFISENLTEYLDSDLAEGESGYPSMSNVDVAANPEEIQDVVREKGFFILPEHLFENVRARANLNNENLNEELQEVFRSIEASATGVLLEEDNKIRGLFDDLDVNSNKLGSTVSKRNGLLLKLLNEVGNFKLGRYAESHNDTFGDAYEYLMGMYASSAGKSGGEYYTPQSVSELLAHIAVDGKKTVNKVYDSADASDVQIIEAEADIIRRAFDAYLSKVSMEQFTQDITDEGVLNRDGKPFSPETPRSWLKREAYTGTLTLGRFHTPNLGEHAVTNGGVAPMYRVENAIPAIINTDTFAAVQAERKRRRDAGAHANWSIPTSCFTSKLTCSICGKNYARSGKRSTADKVNYVWMCRTRRDGVKRTGGRTCTNKTIPEATLKDVCCEVLGLDEFSPDVFEQQIERITMATPNRITFNLHDGHVIDREWQSQQRLKAWTPERRKAWSEYQKAQWAKKRAVATADGEVA